MAKSGKKTNQKSTTKKVEPRRIVVGVLAAVMALLMLLPMISMIISSAGAVTQSEMRPGDLVFYTNSSGTVNHVAMYIGNGQVVHAASRRSGIKISQWNYRSPARIRNVID